MAEEDAALSGLGETLTKKAGPFPLWVYIVGVGGAYWYLKKKQAASSSSGTTGQQTDSAGNVGVIDPDTGYVEGSVQDDAALAAMNNGPGATSTGSSGSTTAGQYATNEDWARAAINYLVGIGVDPTSANAAITQFIGSQTLTSEQQGEVNLAIQALGAPPNPPTPGGSPGGIVTPPSGGTTYATNPPTGLAVASKTSSTIAVKWNKTTNASAYTVTYWTGSAPHQTQTVSGTAASATLTGLKAGALYTIQVQAMPAKPGDPSASITATTTAAPSGGQPPTKQPPSPPKAQTHVYIVQHGDTLSGIAAKNHTTLAEIKTLNPVYWTNPKYDNGNMIFAGDKVTLPGA